MSILWLAALPGIPFGLNGGAAPFYAVEFGLDDAGIARVFGWVALGTLFAIGLSSAMDRIGRRRMTWFCTAGLALSSLAVSVTPTLLWFVIAQIFAMALARVLLTCCNVTVSEELPSASRARGQSWLGFIHQIGFGLGLVSAAVLVDFGQSWRWAWVGCAVLVIPVAWMARGLRENRVFRSAAASDDFDRSRLRTLWAPALRARTVVAIGAAVLGNISGMALSTWTIYHPVRTLGLSPVEATAVVIGGGVVGLIGLPLGAWATDRFGRRPTLLVADFVGVVSITAYYWVPGDFAFGAFTGLVAVFSLGMTAAMAGSVAFRLLMVEAFPTQVRGTIAGASIFGAAIGALVAQFGGAELTAAFDSQVLAITALALVEIPATLLVVFVLPETRGAELDRVQTGT